MPRERGTHVAWIDKEAYIDIVINMLTAGATQSQIYRHSLDKGWNVSRRTICSYIAKAKEIIQAEQRDEKGYRTALSGRRLDDLYLKNLQINDFKAALATQCAIISLYGLNEKPNKISDELTIMEMIGDAYEEYQREHKAMNNA